jgi:hypothetical protein
MPPRRPRPVARRAYSDVHFWFYLRQSDHIAGRPSPPAGPFAGSSSGAHVFKRTDRPPEPGSPDRLAQNEPKFSQAGLMADESGWPWQSLRATADSTSEALPGYAPLYPGHPDETGAPGGLGKAFVRRRTRPRPADESGWPWQSLRARVGPTLPIEGTPVARRVLRPVPLERPATRGRFTDGGAAHGGEKPLQDRRNTESPGRLSFVGSAVRTALQDGPGHRSAQRTLRKDADRGDSV